MSDNTSTLIGILLDVSGSMKNNVGGGVQKERGSWVRSIFQVIDDLIKYDVSCRNSVFSVGVGASRGYEIFDLISTLEQFPNGGSSDHHRDYRTFDETIERILNILERSGASTVRKWAEKPVIRSTVSHEMATLILSKLESDNSFVKSFVNDCLPPACRDFSDPTDDFKAFTKFLNSGYNVYASVVSTFRTATKEDIIGVVNEAKGMLLKSVSVESIFSVKQASNIVHGCVDKEQLTESRINELTETVTPVIYGRTPLFGSLKQAIGLFSDGRWYKKLLFILSDGMPTDVGNKYRLFSKFRDANITVVSCFITNSTQVEPRRLHSEASHEWEDGAKFLFGLSSTIPTQLLPRTIFIKRGWKIDIENNETKLFLHFNHPDHIRDACDLARNVVCCQEALSDVLASVSLDIYINQSRPKIGFHAQMQKGRTCYANASAAVLHLSMKRILGRQGGYPDFNQLRQHLIDKYGEHGANTLRVLQSVCPPYRLHCREVTLQGALLAVTAKRPVVARFRLSEAEWEVFEEFYDENPTAVLTQNKIDISRRLPGVKTRGHAVVLTSYNSECLCLMNSWGEKWGDMGFFRVQTADVLGLKFCDVFWTKDDLTGHEKSYYAKYGSEMAAKLMNSLTSLQKSEYQCLLCSQKSLVTEFTGILSRAKCPKCHGEFPSDEAGNILALNMYLTSLSR